MINEIDKQIAALDIPALSAALDLGAITPRDYQWLVYVLSGNEIRRYSGPFIVTASVGAGKTIMMAMLAKRFQDMGMKGILLARQAELIEQNAEAMWQVGAKNSIFSAGLGMKSIAYPVVAGTEKTVYNALYAQLGDFVPSFLLLDEAHMLNWEDLMSEEPTTQYAQIIKALQLRCMERTGKELRIIGYTGSPFRHTTPIIGPFWKKQVCDISSEYLVNRGFLVPTIFGDTSKEMHYDLSMFHSDGEDGAVDFAAEQLAAMQKEILSQGSLTQKIMIEVQARTAERNGVLITCSGKKHCEEAAKYLPAGSYIIVTESMGMKSRKKALDDAKNGRVKYVFQIGCLTTGVDCSYWDTSVILRKIGSLTLLIQLLGRGMRLLKDFLAEKGIVKDDHLVLDYTDTMAELGQLYHNPILEAADLAKAKQEHDTVPCPKCNTENSPRARRCIGDDASTDDGRCEYFFSSKECVDREIDGVGKIKGCGALNDPCARQCRKCGQQIYDPNAKLNERFYTDDDYVDVEHFSVELTRSQDGLIYTYHYTKDGSKVKAREVFMPERKEAFMKNMWKVKGVIPHVQDPKARREILSKHNAKQIMSYLPFIASPKRITHRVNDKGGDIINRKVFAWDL